MTKRETNILKGIGIILMYFHHLFYLKDNYISYNIDFGVLGESRTVIISQMCKVCVAVFVFASSYGITKSLNSRYNESTQVSYSNYCVERYLKLMSGFWFIWLVAQLTSCIGDRYKIYGQDIILRIKYTVIDFFGSANALGTPSLNATWWYMPFAILLIFIMPCIWMVVKKIGIGSLIIALFLPVYMGTNISNSINFYMFTIVLGILLAENNVLENIKEKITFSIPKTMGVSIILVFVLLLLLYMRYKAVSVVVVALYDGLFTLVLCFFSMNISIIPVVGKALEFIGVHSMNMFLTHTFIKAYYFQDFSYQWKYPWLILLVLLVDTLIISVIIEWIKKSIGYNKLTQRVVNKSKVMIEKVRG